MNDDNRVPCGTFILHGFFHNFGVDHLRVDFRILIRPGFDGSAGVEQHHGWQSAHQRFMFKIFGIHNIFPFPCPVEESIALKTEFSRGGIIIFIPEHPEI